VIFAHSNGVWAGQKTLFSVNETQKRTLSILDGECAGISNTSPIKSGNNINSSEANVMSLYRPFGPKHKFMKKQHDRGTVK